MTSVVYHKLPIFTQYRRKTLPEGAWVNDASEVFLSDGNGTVLALTDGTVRVALEKYVWVTRIRKVFAR